MKRFPKASVSNRQKGWTLDLTELTAIRNAAQDLGHHFSPIKLEQVEDVILSLIQAGYMDMTKLAKKSISRTNTLSKN